MFLFTCLSHKHYINFVIMIWLSKIQEVLPERFARFLSQVKLIKTNEMVAVMAKLKGIFNLILSSMRFAFMSIR